VVVYIWLPHFTLPSVGNRATPAAGFWPEFSVTMLGMLTRDRHNSNGFDIAAQAVLLCGLLILVGESGCGSHSGLRSDGATAAAQGTGGGAGSGAGGALPGTGGAGGADAASVTRVDSAVILADCPEIPCLVPAANLIAACKPSYTCTTEAAGLSFTRCFDNGIKVWESYGTGNTPSGHIVMAVKKDGVSCYSVDDSYADAAVSTGILTYKDAAGSELLTLSSQGSGDDATCPGLTPVALPTSGPCAVASAALGGLMPAASCLNSTTGVCAF